MKKRIALAFLALVAGYFILRELKGEVIDWYAAHYYERTTAHPSAPTPDQIVLTWSHDPCSTQTVQWRTDTSVTDGVVMYREEGQSETELQEAKAKYAVLEDSLLTNDPVNHRFTAVLEGLDPATRYTYRVGSLTNNTWSDWLYFETAPDEVTPFSFVYMGDSQRGLGYWGSLLHNAHERHPDAKFYVIAGDLINSGDFRQEWDAFFLGGKGVFDQRPVIPVPGNHDYDYYETLRIYLSVFDLPKNGPETLEEEHAYSFTYSNALFVVLDSNQDAASQTAWLEDVLSKSTAKWKFAVYHHPAYPSAPHRANEDVKVLWGALFDKYHVDMALQGHDHAYLRTYPMRGGEKVASAAEGTYYVVSVSGQKFYEQEPHDYAEVAFAKTPTYQIISIDTNPDVLHYRAYDFDGNLKDEITIEK